MTNVEAFAFRGPRRRSSDVIHIGLVNNMPDAALRATELQFARLLKDAAGAIDVRLHFFSFSDIARGELALSRMEGIYADADNIPGAQIDALIITGAEPREADLRGEPYWAALAQLTDWAQTGTISTIFSCLAAHAAVLHLNGVMRHPLPQKLSGIFVCETVADDPLLFNMPAQSAVPHSRLNELVEGDLTAQGYRILSRMQGGGVNLFVRQTESLFVFLQGHPEYDDVILGREFIRDLGRYLRGEWDVPPPIPENYFDPATEGVLSESYVGGNNSARLARYSEIVGQAALRHAWRADSVKLFGNWLTLVAAEKARRRVKAAAGIPLHRLRRSA